MSKNETEKKPASLRELKLLITDNKGRQLDDDVLEEIQEEQEFIKDMNHGDEMPEEMSFRIRKRGQVFDHLKMSIQIMEMPKGDKGISRKEGKSIESLLDKLYEAEEADERPDSVLIDEGEWKHLRDRVADHPFPNHGRATRAYQRNVIDDTEKVPVIKAVPDQKATAEEK